MSFRKSRTPLMFALFIFGVAQTCGLVSTASAEDSVAPFIATAKSGRWSEVDTWEGGKIPDEGARVRVSAGHSVIYDVKSDAPIRFIHIAGTLSFAPDKDTRLVVGLIRVEPGETATEEGFECDLVTHEEHHHGQRPALEVGSPNQPIEAAHTAEIRLVLLAGMDPKSCPAIVCCGGRMDFHGTPLSRTWVKLGATAEAGAATVKLNEPVTGWRVGDRVIITATRLGRDTGQGTEGYQTEERLVKGIEGDQLTLDKPLVHQHSGEGEFRGEIANLSRNVVVESAEPQTARGHTMYHRHSAGSIGYAEFRHLGKQGVLGRYALHFHLCGTTMRGSSVVGASIWDSGNRWLTIHGTNYLVVRDCVGYKSIGHGFFLEDGTEVYNTLDRNLAVRSDEGRPLPKQVLPFDANDGSGFWWANCLNTFTRNVTCENNRYGYRFEAIEGSSFKTTLPIMQPDGTEMPVDIRTLPFVRFEDNEAHCDGLYGFNLGEGVNRAGPDERHPYIVRNMKIWEIHYAFRPQTPALLVENLQIHNSVYGVYHPNFDRHVYRNITISRKGSGGDAEPFNRGHDDDSVQYGTLTVDGLTFAGHQNSGMPLIQMSDDNPTGLAESHFRNVQITDRKDENRRALLNLGGGPRPTPKTPRGVPVYVHDHFGPGKHAKVVSVRANDVKGELDKYHPDEPLTGDESRVLEVTEVKFPELLTPVDDLPPATVITGVTPRADGGWLVRGTTTDNGQVKQVLVNGHQATALRDGFAEWEVTLSAADAKDDAINAHGEDSAGNIEKLPHNLALPGHDH